jgi:hypothetical protein
VEEEVAEILMPALLSRLAPWWIVGHDFSGASSTPASHEGGLRVWP